MIECTIQMLSSLIDIMPAVIGIYIMFDFIGTLLFGKRWKH